mmetsp:Transcript_24139/g.42632  ORF Transcript_24139/g.42632 Transcript_24139/m.42632 type:complete len:161 (+) Transcript_24139:119-601(+)
MRWSIVQLEDSDLVIYSTLAFGMDELERISLKRCFAQIIEGSSQEQLLAVVQPCREEGPDLFAKLLPSFFRRSAKDKLWIFCVCGDPEERRNLFRDIVLRTECSVHAALAAVARPRPTFKAVKPSKMEKIEAIVRRQLVKAWARVRHGDFNKFSSVVPIT